MPQKIVENQLLSMFLAVTCQHTSGACQSHSRPVQNLREDIDVHYTYTLSHTGEENSDDNVEMDVEVDLDDEADDLDEGTMEQDENEPQFDSIL
jgi:hypothetical protein